ncbi:spermidine/putrescine transport system permease protein [Hydrogenispora ethanolica]|jgi:spermidine/putrescine transport system permease protein|uniref:Spermidine/putrescine transport system permease protein n=1 Tax=Hydrogenispora ethanolica TaxID=1082276 RepID=A0A4R1QWL8_HYDET|nr:ABC transporter permease [Hydrogenispora ethanolica]TCL55574.1 spermidine/putrescine transport system permease protein [Hydrogenispora ethanolica]
MVKLFMKRGYLFGIFLFLYAPIIVLALYSFNNSHSRGVWDGFTLKWYIQMFQDRQILTSLYYSLVIGTIASLVATVIGTMAAFGIDNMKSLPQGTVMNLTYLPVLNPDIVTGIAFMLLYIFLHLQLGFMTLLLSHVTFNIPYVILSVLPRIKQLDRSMYEAALDLGATPALAFRKVILPEIMPGVLTGLLLSFTLSLDDFVISFFTTGSGVSNLSITIYSMARRGINPKINALSTLMFVSVLTLLIIVNIMMARQKAVKSKEA